MDPWKQYEAEASLVWDLHAFLTRPPRSRAAFASSWRRLEKASLRTRLTEWHFGPQSCGLYERVQTVLTRASVAFLPGRMLREARRRLLDEFADFDPGQTLASLRAVAFERSMNGLEYVTLPEPAADVWSDAIGWAPQQGGQYLTRLRDFDLRRWAEVDGMGRYRVHYCGNHRGRPAHFCFQVLIELPALPPPGAP